MRVGPTSAFSSCIFTGVHGPIRTVQAKLCNLTPPSRAWQCMCGPWLPSRINADEMRTAPPARDPDPPGIPLMGAQALFAVVHNIQYVCAHIQSRWKMCPGPGALVTPLGARIDRGRRHGPLARLRPGGLHRRRQVLGGTSLASARAPILQSLALWSSRGRICHYVTISI
jgi:hypothetical protein